MASPLAWGAGASAGLDDALRRELEQATQAETVRHNQAGEALQSRTIDQNEWEKQALADERNARVAALKKAADDEGVQKGQEDAILNDPNASSQIKDFLRLRRSLPKGEAVPYQLITEPTGPPHTTPRMQQRTELLDGKPTDLNYTAEGKYLLPATGEDVTPRVTHYEKPQSPFLLQTDQGFGTLGKTPGAQVQPVMAAGGGQAQPKPSATIANRMDMAGKIGGHFDDLEQEINDADSKGLLGPLAGRTMSDFLLHGVGSTGNPEYDDLLSALQMDLKLTSTGVASIHGRGQGANAGIAKGLQDYLDQTKMTKAGLMGGIREMKKWVSGYATPATPGGAAPAAAPASDPYQDYLNRNK